MDEPFASIATFAYLHEAQTALETLKEALITAFLAGEMTAATFAGNFGLGPQMRLMVARSDVKRARDILATLHEQVPMPEGWEEDFPAEEGFWICSICDEAVEDEVEICPWCGGLREGRCEEE